MRTSLAAGYATVPLEYHLPSDKPVRGVVPFARPYNASFPAPEACQAVVKASEDGGGAASERVRPVLEGVVVVLAGTDFVMLSAGDLERLIEMSGGIVVPSLTGPETPDATHVVFGGGYADLVLPAASEAGIPVVSEDWIFECLQYSMLVAEKRFLVSYAPLDELAFVVANHGPEDGFAYGRASVARLIYAYGGTQYESVYAKVPHVYYVVPLSVTFDQISAVLDDDVPIVFETFVYDSVRKGYAVPEAGYRVTREAFFFPGLEVLPLVPGVKAEQLKERAKTTLSHVWYDLSAAAKMESGIGFMCLLPSCNTPVPGPKAYLRSHMIVHHLRGEWAPLGTEPFDSPTVAYATNGVKYATFSKGSRQYAAAAARAASGTVLEPGSAAAAGSLRSGGCVTVWDVDAQCCGEPCLLPPLPVQVLTCSQCEKVFHGKCLRLTAQLVDNLTDRFDWRCNDCKACKVCGDSASDEAMLFCDACDKAYHTFCLNPPLERAPEGSWHCSECSGSQSVFRKNKSRQLSQAQAEILDNWLFSHVDNPYPTEEEKHELAALTALPFARISSWFTNARRRKLRRYLEQRAAAEAAAAARAAQHAE
ncbi:uncharacterized protein AMSG_04353 [Thecamonas trahens ATCC 50062]|uniref:Uncharacterized protein n=1 Tax=Thecamonas trahens ATCC 50062 TaxID=461836 RepID=A0A0L0D704_THETB|nr:hypothetical protein AMSG_04353 [Thecamonas trahens ATCC 50062]KNC48124.1 hypothetical protein AMSG_04353 [Thecamonas trahens ATCC 50062]|eukprot:XP_013758695.1 hypothetical protein AMSG_04353 [Thecamonas trahens ATCC 50062]